MKHLWACLFALSLHATPTRIVDVLLQPNGNPQTPVAAMDITISQTAFVSGNNFYPGFTLTPHPVTDAAGNLDVWLEPNVTGQLYQVLFRATNGVITRECWNVPASMTPLRIKDVRSTACSTTPSAVVQIGQLAQSGALQGYLITWNDTLKRWEADVPASGIPPGNSGGIPYYNSSTTVASTPAWPLNAIMVGGGAGNPPQITDMTYDQFGGVKLRVPGNVVITGNISASGGNLIGNTVTSFTTLSVGVFTVATLPTCGQSAGDGFMAAASDLLSPTFLGIAAGGGSVHGPVYCNGTDWITY